MKCSRFVSACFVTAIVASASAQKARLTFHSDGEYIGQGEIVDNTYVAPIDNLWGGCAGTGGQYPFTVFFAFGDSSHVPNDEGLLIFASASNSTPLTTGTYLDAQTAWFQDPGHPGLDMGFQNRGANTVTGQFTINKLTWLADPAAESGYRVSLFDVDFELHPYARDAALHGHFTYEAVPEPSSWLALGLGLAILRRRRHK